MVSYLNVFSDPSGAEVTIDGRKVGKTPIRNIRKLPGFYNIRIEKAGYVPWIHLNYQIRLKDLVVNISQKLLTQEEILERVEEEEEEEEEFMKLSEEDIQTIKDAEKAGLITAAIANRYFERDMKEELTKKDISEIEDLREKLKEVKPESEFITKLKEFSTHFVRGDMIKAAFSLGGLLFASVLPGEERVLTGTVPLMPIPVGPGIPKTVGISPSSFLKSPKKIINLFTKLTPQGQGKVISAWKTTELGKRSIPILLQNVVKTQGLSWFKKALPWLAGAIGIMTATTFMEFLYEETLQSVGIAIWVAMSNKQWGVAQEAVDAAWPLLEKAEWVYRNVGWLAPYSFDVFNSYAKATRIQYNTYEKVIAAQGDAGPDPSKDGKVFDKEEFAANLAKGRAPSEGELVVEPEEVEEEVPEEEVPEEEVPEEEVPEEIDLLDISTIKARINSIKPDEIPKPFTSEQAWSLNLAFEDILKLTEGAEQLSEEEFDGLVGSFSLNLDEQKEVLKLLFMDLWLLTKGAAQLSSNEYIELKEKYGNI